MELWVERVHADEVPKRATVEMSVDDIEDVDFDLQGEEADYDSSSHEAVTDLKPDDSEIEVSVDVVTPFTSVEEAPQASVETSAFELSTSEVPTMEEPAAEAPIAVEVPMPEDLSVKAHIVSGHPEEPEACLQESTFESPPVDTPMLIESSSELQESLVEVAVVEQSVTDIPALLEDPTEVPKSPVEAIVEARLELESPAEVLLSEESPIVSPMLEEAPFEPSVHHVAQMNFLHLLCHKNTVMLYVSRREMMNQLLVCFLRPKLWSLKFVTLKLSAKFLQIQYYRRHCFQPKWNHQQWLLILPVFSISLLPLLSVLPISHCPISSQPVSL